jgi:hypothetical protein
MVINVHGTKTKVHAQSGDANLPALNRNVYGHPSIKACRSSHKVDDTNVLAKINFKCVNNFK